MRHRTWRSLVLGVLAAVAMVWAGGCAEKAPKPAVPSTSTAAAASATAAEYPQITIANEKLKLTVYLPDAARGYYRGVRFDWAGMIAHADFAGHWVYAPWKARHDPMGHDHVIGPAEEFDMDDPPGYADAKPGEPFMKIGVGHLVKAKDAKYAFSAGYKIAEAGKRLLSSGKDWIEFHHDLPELRGWACSYVKRIEIVPGQSAFILSHTLKNTGTKPIDTRVYCHNFTIIDGTPVGPDYQVQWPFDVAADGKTPGAVELKGPCLLIPGTAWKSIWMQLAGGRDKVEDNAVVVCNMKTDAGVSITGDQPPAMWRFYAEKTAACPEPFVRIQLAPGEEKRWQSTYTFFVNTK